MKGKKLLAIGASFLGCPVSNVRIQPRSIWCHQSLAGWKGTYGYRLPFVI